MNNKMISRLKGYFEKKENVVLAFLFGSQAKGLSRRVSDWDIGVYFKPYTYMELETERDYPDEKGMWGDLVDILKTDDVDLLVLNRARPSLVFSVLNSGVPLKIDDKKLYLRLLCKTSYEAIDYWNFVSDFFRIREASASLTQENKAILIETLIFLENEFGDIEKFKGFTWEEYSNDRSKRRDVERWIENIVMASLDIAKIILASEKKRLPNAYKETLEQFGLFYFEEEFAKRLSSFAALRNIVVHEYLDINWMRIKDFIKNGEELYPRFIEKVKEFIVDSS
ncbi:MAG: HepT-like ribonuclease domain-containing protein [bacterium]